MPVPLEAERADLPVTVSEPSPALEASPQTPPVKPRTLPAVLSGPFAHTRYRFTTGLRSGEVANILGEHDEVLLSYRSFASVTGIVATLASAIVAVAGLAAVLFLVAEQEPLRAAAALVLTIVFAFFIALLVPRIQVTLYDDGRPALTLSQRTAFPSASYVVSTPNGATLADLRKTFFSRLGRNRWTIEQHGRLIGEALEESFLRAVMRKVAGKFSRRFETDLLIDFGGLEAGRILRRPDEKGQADILELTHDALDRRVAVALATLVLASEP